MFKTHDFLYVTSPILPSSKKFKQIALQIALFVLLLTAITSTASATDITFQFDIPQAPGTPKIESVNNSAIVAGQDSFTVYADITGTWQYEMCCDPSGSAGSGPNAFCEHECAPDCDFSACEATDYYGMPDPRITSNPACIPSDVDPDGMSRPECSGKSNPVVHYYYNGDPLAHGQQTMTYDTDSGTFKANIPITNYLQGDVVTWYFVAGDNTGNVTTQVPDPTVTPCTTLSSWDTSYQTPAFDNCSLMNSYSGINGFACDTLVYGTPVCYSSNYSVNDPQNDTCGSSNEPMIDAPVDILGIVSGSGAFDGLAGSRVVCTRIKLNANSPDVGSSSGAIDTYILAYYNPSIIDPNPHDSHILNATVVTYSPEVSGADPNLTRVLWDGDCVTDPNTADPLVCKLLVGGGSEERFKIGAMGNELIIITKNDLPNSSTILSPSSMMTQGVLTTGKIQLEGDLPFWRSDSTPAFTLIAKNQTATITDGNVAPAPPFVAAPSTCKWPDGTAFTSGKCDKSSTKPVKNTCRLTISASPDCGITGEYDVYYNNIDDRASSTYVGNFTSNLCGTNTFEYDIASSSLDGFPRYFFLSSKHSTTGEESDISAWSKTTCTPEDWVAPDPPTDLSCATPATQEKKCECTWTADTSADPSLYGFMIYRDSQLLNTIPTIAVTGPNSYTDSSTSLETGSSYTYSVKATDAGGELSTEVTASCTPEDLKAPEKVDSLAVTLVPSWLKVNLDWNENADTDIAGYNAYYCYNEVPGASCETEENYEKLNLSLITGATELPSTAMTPSFVDNQDYCFWIEACDNCDTAGTCPSNGGTPNCSNFDTFSAYRKCLTVTIVPDTVYPDFPQNLSATAPAEGSSCSLTWDRVCSDGDGAFPTCDYPAPEKIMGYYVMRAQPSGGATDCSGVSDALIPVINDPAGTAIISQTPGYTDSGLSNDYLYCYLVYAFDASNNYSRDSQPDPVACTPHDTLPPASPQMNSSEFSSDSCVPSWSAVTDSDSIKYNTYKCEDKAENCTSGDFNAVAGGTAISTLSYSDQVGKTSSYFTYCITATDESDNESVILSDSSTTAVGAANCGSCFASEKPAAPTAIQATPYSTSINHGISAWWNDSDSDDGSGSYNVYLCADTSATPASCTKIGNGVAGSRTSESPFETSDAGVDSGQYYVAVTYQGGDSNESLPAFFETSVSIVEAFTDPCDATPVPSSCSITITVQGAFTRISLVENGDIYEKTETPITGVEIHILSDDSDISTSVFSRSVGDDGTIAAFTVDENSISPATKYTIAAVLPPGSFDSPFEVVCRNPVTTDSFCTIRLEITALETGDSIYVKARQVPNSANGYGAEVANSNGDGAVNLFDLAAIKNAMNTEEGDTCYRQWADMNLDGQINMLDLTILKEHMGEIFDNTDPAFDPALIESKDPLPSECN